MPISRTQSVFSEFTKAVNRHPWLYGGMIFLAFVGTAAAAAQTQSVVDLFSKEGGIDSLSPEFLRRMGQEILEKSSVESICSELNGYISMCNFLSADFVTVKGGMEVSDCAEGGILGQSNNPAAMVCNSAELLKKMLPQNVLDTCAEMAESAARTMGMD